MPADFPSSGAAESQAPRCAAESLSKSAADACIGIAESAIMTATPQLMFPTLWLIVPMGPILAPAVRNISHSFGTDDQARCPPPECHVGGCDVDCARRSCNCIRTLQRGAAYGRPPIGHRAPSRSARSAL